MCKTYVKEYIRLHIICKTFRFQNFARNKSSKRAKIQIPNVTSQNPETFSYFPNCN